MKKFFGLMILGVIAVWLVGCGAAQNKGVSVAPAPAAGATLPVVAQEMQDSITVKGVVEPARSVTLRAGSGGVIVAAPVAEGARVTAGDALVRFDAADAELAIQQAEAGLALAQAQLDLAKAGARPEQIAVIAAQLQAADALLAQATAQRDAENARAAHADVLDAQASVMEAELAHTQADERHDDMMKCYTYTLPDGSEQTACPTLGTYEELTRFQMESAYAALLAAQAQYGAAQGLVAPQRDAAQAAVQSAQAQRDAVQAQLDLAQAGARAEAVAVAAAAVQRAESALAQARAALAFTVVAAPFDGVLTDLPVKAGDAVAAGEPLLTLATVDQLHIKTTDLTELDVVKVTEGQRARVTLEAQPGAALSGHVIRIEPQGNNYLGDVIYTVVIALDAPAPDWLRWGMTAKVEMQNGESASQESASQESANGESAKGNLSAMPIIAEAILEPERWGQLRFTSGGKIADVLVATGDRVAEGDVLLRLDATVATLAVQEAEAAVATARAQLALAQAGPRPAEVAAVEARLAAAQGELQRATALREQLKAGMNAESVGAQAQLEAVSAAYKQALVAIGQSDDEDAHKQLNLLTLRVQAAEARVAALPKVAAARLRAANAGVQAAEANIAAIQAERDLLLAPPTPESIAVAEAEVRQAEAALAAARVALARTELRAPFSGVVTQVYAEVGQPVGAGQPVGILANLDGLQLRVIDLGERDVIRLTAGQTVQITVDALPGRSFTGRIAQIKPQSADYRGDVAYPVVVHLEERAPELRWGMRATVEIP